jgi:SAM-dependent methyltransferase
MAPLVQKPERTLWKSLKRRIKKILHRPHLDPHEYVHETDAEVAGWFNHRTGELLTGFQILPDDTVVDVGCGDGGSCEFAGHVGAAVIAVDIDPAMIEKVKQRMVRTPARSWRTIVSDGNPLPLATGSASKVLCQEVMEHVDDPQTFIAELVRIGEPGAQYLLSVPDPASEAVQRHVAPECHWRKPNHLRIFGRDEFDALVRGAGLVIESRLSYSFFWSMWWTLFWADRAPSHINPNMPVLKYWHKTWRALLEAPDGAKVRNALEQAMPKSQILIARKPA